MEETNAARNSKTMRLRLLIGLSVLTASYCLRSEAQTNDWIAVAWGNKAYEESAVLPNLIRYNAIAAGCSHSLALKSDGTVLAWGDNSSGQSTVPVNLVGVIAIAAGASHS